MRESKQNYKIPDVMQIVKNHFELSDKNGNFVRKYEPFERPLVTSVTIHFPYRNLISKNK